MGVISNGYLIIFLPLIISLFCQIFNKRSLSFFATLLTLLTLLYLILAAFPQILFYKKIVSDFSLSLVSIGMEFSFDIFNIIFILPIIFLKIITLFFYQKDIKNLLSDKKASIFYATFLLNIFAIVGIFTTNNIFNLFLFIEIYSLSYFAAFSLLSDEKSTKLSFNYFCLNVVSSMLLLFAFMAIYLSFHEVNFYKISFIINKQLGAISFWFLPAIFALFFSAILIKFFPFWLYFKKIKLINPIADSVTIDILFVKTAIGVFLTLKFIHYFFNNVNNEFDFNFILIALMLLLAVYSSVKLYKQKHLKTIAAYGCLNNIAFIFISVLLQQRQTDLAAVFYFLNLILVNLFIFIFAGFLRRYYQSSSINKVWMIGKNNFLLTMPLQFLLFFIAGFPFSILFIANWNLALALINISDYRIIILPAIFLSMFVQFSLGGKLISAFFAKNAIEPKILPFFGFKKHAFHILSFWLLLAAIFITSFMMGFFNGVF